MARAQTTQHQKTETRDTSSRLKNRQKGTKNFSSRQLIVQYTTLEGINNDMFLALCFRARLILSTRTIHRSKLRICTEAIRSQGMPTNFFQPMKFDMFKIAVAHLA